MPFRLIVDLRAVGEDDPPVGLWTSGAEPETVNIELFPIDRVDDPDLTGGLIADPTGTFTREYMRTFYRDMVDIFAAGCLRELALRIGAERQVPVLIHCTAGQDRTGFAAAMLLLALGVPREVVVDDYMRTLDHYTLERVTGWVYDRLRPDPASVLTAESIAPLAVEPGYIEDSIDLVLERFGSVEAYWEHAGVGPEQLQALHHVLLD